MDKTIYNIEHKLKTYKYKKKIPEISKEYLVPNLIPSNHKLAGFRA